MKKKYMVLEIEKGFKKNSNFNHNIYGLLTDIFFYEDIYQYQDNIYFIDITNYEELYKKTAYQLALDLKNKITKKNNSLKIGIGTNLFLAMTACTIMTKNKKTKIAYLDEKEYILTCSKYKPISDFWQISNSMSLKLKKLGIETMEDIRNYSYETLYNEFGYNAEYLINHSLGLEPTTIEELNKNKTPKTISSSVTFKNIKSRKESMKELKNLLDFNILKLKENGLVTKKIYLYIKYANNIIPKEVISIDLLTTTNSYKSLMQITFAIYKEKLSLFFPVEKLAISFGKIEQEKDISYPIPKKRKKLNIWMKNLFYKKKTLAILQS